MKNHLPDFEEMAWKYLDSELSPADFETFERLLENDPEARLHYQAIAEIQQGLEQYAVSDVPQENTIVPFQAKNRIVRLPWAMSIGAAAVAIVGLFLHFASDGEKLLKAEYVALRDVDFRGETVEQGERANTHMMHLMHGAVAIKFPGNTQAVIEGPAWYQIQDDQTIKVSAGTITVDHRGKPGNFKILTPVGRLTEMGTKFGVSVGNGVNDSIVMTEVYEGKVIFDGGKQNSFTIPKGGAYAFVGNNLDHVIKRSLDNGPVSVEPTFALDPSAKAIRTTKNLASGKPVTSSAYYNNTASGETFGPSALTDNRTNDSGSPWDWAFWLGENGKDATFTVDLLEPLKFSKIELQNTRNRQHLDRETRRFLVEISIDGSNFTPLLDGYLKSVRDRDNVDFPFESFGFKPVTARFVRVTAFFPEESEQTDELDGVGLNEIRILE